jgi:hypothetical protein
MTLCPHCHGRVHEVLGVTLPTLKFNLVRTIKAAGDCGISSAELVAALWAKPVERATIKSHLGQINDRLAETDFQIVAEGRGKHARWILRRGLQ